MAPRWLFPNIDHETGGSNTTTTTKYLKRKKKLSKKVRLTPLAGRGWPSGGLVIVLGGNFSAFPAFVSFPFIRQKAPPTGQSLMINSWGREETVFFFFNLKYVQ